jgi:Galactose oxidase, central domain
MKKIMLMLWLVLGTIALIGQLNAQTWQSAGPTPRWGHSAVLNTTTTMTVVFGGATTLSNSNSGIHFNDVWRLNGNLTWTALNPTGTPPAPRLLHSAVYDSVNNRMTVFGGAEGNSSPCENDVWVLTNANGKGATPAWVELAPTGTAPAPRLRHGAVYDPNTNAMIVFGGNDCFSTFFGDVWVLSNANGLGGTPVWTQLAPAGGGPGARTVNGGVTYDSANNRLIVFGGSPVNNDVWILTNANGQGGTPTWTELFPSGTLPPGRAENSTVYDPKSNRLVIFGGGDASNNVLHDAWILTNANGFGGTPVWTQISSSLFPEGRSGHTGVYNPKTNKMTIFGGIIVFSPMSIVTNDVWVLGHANGK